jgi:hypothetical protein
MNMGPYREVVLKEGRATMPGFGGPDRSDYADPGHFTGECLLLFLESGCAIHTIVILSTAISLGNRRGSAFGNPANHRYQVFVPGGMF